MPDPDRDRGHAEPESGPRSIFTHRPDPGPIPEVLREGPKPKGPASDPGSGVAGMAKAWAVALDFIFTILAGAGVGWPFDRWRSSAPVRLLSGPGVAVGSIITFIPALLSVGPDFWGIAVLLCGVGRGLAVLGLAFVLDHAGTGLMTRPLYFGALGGAVLILIAESAVAIRILAQLER